MLDNMIIFAAPFAENGMMWRWSINQ